MRGIIFVFLSVSLIFCLYFLTLTQGSEKGLNGLFGLRSKNGLVVLLLPELKSRLKLKSSVFYRTQSDETQILGRWKKALIQAEPYRSFNSFFQGNGSVFQDYVENQFVSFNRVGKVDTVDQLEPIIQSTSPNTRQTSTEKINMCFIANRPGHMSFKDPYSKNIYEIFSKLGASLYIVPLGMELILDSEQDLSDFHTKVSQFCSVMVALGGYDLDPRLYGQKNTVSVETHFQMDETELKLIRKYSEVGKGVFYGICRGHQAYAVAMGGELYQDISLLNDQVSQHQGIMLPDGQIKSVWHDIELKDEKNALFDAVGKRKFRVNSRHHQAVKAVPGAQVIAWAKGGIVEAVEKRNLTGNVIVLTVQFHPEDMYTEVSRRLLAWMVANGKKVRDKKP